MFWRFGSDDDSRPVAATAWWKVVCSRPSAAIRRRQRLDVGRAQLRVDPPLEQLVDHRVRRAQLLEHRRVGRVAGLRPLALGQVELEEQDLLELLGAAEVELVADVDVDLLPRAGRSRRANSRSRTPSASRSSATPTASIRARTGMSGSSTSRNSRSRLDLVEPALERLADGQRGQRLEPGPGRRRQLGRRRQDLVEVLGDDVGDRLAAQRGVEDVGRDLRVERDRQRRRGRGRRRRPRRGPA